MALTLQSHTLPDFRALAKHLTSTLPRYAVPIFLRVTDAMTLTGNMKHQKHKMREEGVDPEKVRGEKVFWLKDEGYVEFTGEDWEGLKAGYVKL